MGECVCFPFEKIRYDDAFFDPEHFSERELRGESATILAFPLIHKKQTSPQHTARLDGPIAAEALPPEFFVGDYEHHCT